MWSTPLAADAAGAGWAPPPPRATTMPAITMPATTTEMPASHHSLRLLCHLDRPGECLAARFASRRAASCGARRAFRSDMCLPSPLASLAPDALDDVVGD